MEFDVLGPLTVTYRGKDHAPTAAKPRQILALFLLKANTAVSVAQITEELWGATPPRTATAAVHTYVAQLRQAMHDRLVTRERGYVLTVRRGELDFDIVQAELRDARHEHARGRYHFVSRHLRHSLNRWRAPVLADVLPGPLLTAEIAAVERVQRDAVRLRIDADLLLGRHRELIGELSALAFRYPDDEGFAGQLMLALYRSGRQADAIAAFHRLRLALRDRLGSVPSSGLAALYSDIISASPALTQPTAQHSSAASGIPGLAAPPADPAGAWPASNVGTGSVLQLTPGLPHEAVPGVR